MAILSSQEGDVLLLTLVGLRLRIECSCSNYSLFLTCTQSFSNNSPCTEMTRTWLHIYRIIEIQYLSFTPNSLVMKQNSCSVRWIQKKNQGWVNSHTHKTEPKWSFSCGWVSLRDAPKKELFLDKTHMDCRSDAAEQEGDQDQGQPFYVHLISPLHEPCLMCPCLLGCHINSCIPDEFKNNNTKTVRSKD